MLLRQITSQEENAPIGNVFKDAEEVKEKRCRIKSFTKILILVATVFILTAVITPLVVTFGGKGIRITFVHMHHFKKSMNIFGREI